MFNLELLMFHCVVWIGEYPIHITQWNINSSKLKYVKEEYPIHTTQWNINSSKFDICQKGIPYPHHTIDLLDRCSTYNCWCSIVWCGMGIPSSQMSNLELLMFYCVVWIWYSFLTDVELRKKECPFHSTQWNINSSKLNICQEGIPYPHHTMEHQQF
jgi:hypothetical protein